MNQDERIEQLEMKVSFQDDNIETLNNEIFDQQRKLHLLKEQVSLLVKKFKAAEPNQLAPEEEEVPPPHY